MSQIVILDASTLTVIDWYFSDSPVIPVTPGITLPVPDGLAWDIVKGVQEGDDVTLVADPTKVQAKTDQAWLDVRAQQRDLLYKSDWTCSVTDYEVPNKDQWIQYRAALRDVTIQSDPFNIVWPTAPTA